MSGDDSPEQTDSSKTDSRDTASRQQRAQIGSRPSTSTDDVRADNADGTVLACPECDKPGVRQRSGDTLRGQPSAGHYACRFCGAMFDEPVERERERARGDPGYLAGELAAADPEDVTGEPMTDGGFPDNYPARRRFNINKTAGQRFKNKIDEHGPGRNWLNDDPEYHLWRAVANIAKSNGAEDLGELGDAVNHLAMARDIAVEEPVTDGGLTSTEAATLVEEVQNSAGPGLTNDESSNLEAVVDYFRNGIGGDTTADTHVEDTRIEAASKLRCLADDLERAARHSTADDVELSLHVSVEETYRGEWGDR